MFDMALNTPRRHTSRYCFDWSVAIWTRIYVHDNLVLINLFADVLAFEDFMVGHKTWLTYSDAADRPTELL